MSSDRPSQRDPHSADRAGDSAPYAEHLPAAEAPEEQIASLTERLDQVEREKRELEDRHVRGLADLDNYKKRVRREQAEASRYAGEAIVRELLPVLDNLELALAHGAGSNDSFAQGVSLVLKSLQDTLKRHGVTEVDAQPGQPFDPTVHEAVDRREVEGEPNRVIDQWQRGYRMHDKLLRPARVVVSAVRSGISVANGGDRD